MSNEKIMSLRAVARHLKCTKVRVAELCAAGKIQGWLIGPPHRRTWRVARSEMKRAGKAKIA